MAEWITSSSTLNESDMQNNATIVNDYLTSQGVARATIGAILRKYGT